MKYIHGRFGPRARDRIEPSQEVAPPLVETDDRMAADYYMTFLEYHSNLSFISSRGPTRVFHPLLFAVFLSPSFSRVHPFYVFSLQRTREPSNRHKWFRYRSRRYKRLTFLPPSSQESYINPWARSVRLDTDKFFILYYFARKKYSSLFTRIILY